MKKLRIVFGVLAAALLAVVALLCVYFYPVYRGADFLQEHVDLQNMTFDLEVTLSEEELTEGQRELVQALAQITGIEKENLLTLGLRGRSCGDTVFVQITPRGSAEPLTELYLSDGEDLVNAAMLYERVRANVTGNLPLLEMFLPQWQSEEFLSLEQAEELFGLDLTGAKEFGLASYGDLFSRKQYFAMLTPMKHSRDEADNRVFSLELQESGVTLQVTLREEEPAVISIQGSAADLEQTLVSVDETLTEMGVEHSFSEQEGLKKIVSVEGSVTMGDAGQLQLPDSRVAQDTVEKIAGIRETLQELFQ